VTTEASFTQVFPQVLRHPSRVDDELAAHCSAGRRRPATRLSTFKKAPARKSLPYGNAGRGLGFLEKWSIDFRLMG